LSFLLPIVNKLILSACEHENETDMSEFFSRKAGAFAIILAPTRELAHQISEVLELLLKYSNSSSEDSSPYCRHWIVSGLIVGGESRKSEKSRLRKGVNILVATPGRLLDHLKTTNSFCVDNLRWLVLDEADNLLHLGFEETLRDILRIINEKISVAESEKLRKKVDVFPHQKQIVLCSATMEDGISKLVEETLRSPLFINGYEKKSIEDAGESNKRLMDNITVPTKLQQYYIMCPAKLRLVNLIGLIRNVCFY
jgi:ATP-dependent RNA helicase DDX31/DBP7